MATVHLSVYYNGAPPRRRRLIRLLRTFFEPPVYGMVFPVYKKEPGKISSPVPCVTRRLSEQAHLVGIRQKIQGAHLVERLYDRFGYPGGQLQLVLGDEAALSGRLLQGNGRVLAHA